MIKRVTSAAAFLALFAGLTLAQDDPFSKNFKVFKDLAPGIDFYGSSQSDIDPFVKPVVEARRKLSLFMGNDLARGAIFVCSTLKQKDAVFDLRAFKQGYKWYLVQLTPEAQREERQARQAAAQAANAQGSQAGDAGQRAGQGAPGGRQRGGQDQAGGRGGQSTQAGPEGGRQGRGQDQGGRGGPGGQQEARAAVTLATQSCYATLMTTLNSEKPYRTSRVEDVSRSPLVDWIDIALTAYATDTTGTNLRFMQDRLDETFPIDDVLIMSRPFVANLESFGIGGAGGGGGGERGQGGAGAAMFTMGGAPGASPLSSIMGGTGERGGGRGAGRVLPKDVQDRMMFDAQAASFFNYLMEKLGAEKVKDIIQQNVKGVESLKVVQGLLGNDMAKVEKDWVAWMKEQKLPENIR